VISSDVVKHVVLRLKEEKLLLDHDGELLIISPLAIFSAATRLFIDDNDSLLLEGNKVVV
jgi:hypothetical protein